MTRSPRAVFFTAVLRAIPWAALAVSPVLPAENKPASEEGQPCRAPSGTKAEKGGRELRIGPAPRAAAAARAALYRKVAGKDPVALRVWTELPTAERTRTLAEVARMAAPPLRLTALRELRTLSTAEDPEGRVLPALVDAALTEKNEKIRGTAREELAHRDRRAVSEKVVGRMEHGDEIERKRGEDVLRAVGGLEPVEVLIEHWRYTWGPGPRAHVIFARQRSYIADYNISGDSWDPVVRRFLVGTVLDVKPLRAFAEHYIVKVLRHLTGKNFGTDREAWRRWLLEQRARRPASPKARPLPVDREVKIVPRVTGR